MLNGVVNVDDRIIFLVSKQVLLILKSHIFMPLPPPSLPPRFPRLPPRVQLPFILDEMITHMIGSTIYGF